MKNEFDQKLDSALDTLEHLKNVCSGPLWERLSRELGDELSSEDILAVVQNYILLNEQRCVIPKAISPDDFRLLVSKMLEARGYSEIPLELVKEAVDRIYSSNDDRVRTLFSTVSQQELISIFEGAAKTPVVTDVAKKLGPAIETAGSQAALARKLGVGAPCISRAMRGRRDPSPDLQRKGMPLPKKPPIPDDSTKNKAPLKEQPKK
jgi:hypothetical protein